MEQSNEEIHIRIKFMNEPDEKERMKQRIQAIIERFDSDALGFFSEPNDIFPKQKTIEQFEDICTMYDLEELSKLEEVKLLKGVLSKYKNNDSYPNVCSLLNILNKR